MIEFLFSRNCNMLEHFANKHLQTHFLIFSLQQSSEIKLISQVNKCILRWLKCLSWDYLINKRLSSSSNSCQHELIVFLLYIGTQNVTIHFILVSFGDLKTFWKFWYLCSTLDPLYQNLHSNKFSGDSSVLKLRETLCETRQPRSCHSFPRK